MVYLCCFERPFRHARHYLGFVPNAERLGPRMQEHRRGQGARLLQVVSEAGIGWEVVRIWPDGDRKLERRLKNWHGAAKLCPNCTRRRRSARAQRSLPFDLQEAA